MTREHSMLDRPMVYVAAYYTANPTHGMREAIDAWEMLLGLGYTPLVPHVSFFLDVVYPYPPAFWYAYDLALMSRCDAIYVCGDPLTAQSNGVALEVAEAERQGMSILRSPSDAALFVRKWMDEVV